MWWHTLRPPDFVFRRNGRVHLNWRGRQFSRLLAAVVCASAFILGITAGYTTFGGSVKGTGCPFHSPVSPLLTLPCVTVCHHISAGVYHAMMECISTHSYHHHHHYHTEMICRLLTAIYLPRRNELNGFKTHGVGVGCMKSRENVKFSF